MIVLGIDPDFDTTGLAVVDTHRLVGLGIAKSKPGFLQQAKELEGLIDHICSIYAIKLAVIEYPFIVPKGYGSRASAHARANPNDLIKIAVIAGAALNAVQRAGVRKIKLVTPSEWKGTIKKEIHQKQVLRNVPKLEAKLKDWPKTQRSHVIDAAGIAWKYRK